MKLTAEHKEILRDEYSKVWDSRMVDWEIKQASGMIEIRDWIIVEDKPRIQTSFWFDDRDNPAEVYREIDAMDKKEYFISRNLKMSEPYRTLERLKTCGSLDISFRRAYLARQYQGTRFASVVTLDPELISRNVYNVTEEDALTGEELDAVTQFYLDELTKFEKRLHTYWKRYGDSKLYFGTYWANR